MTGYIRAGFELFARRPLLSVAAVFVLAAFFGLAALHSPRAANAADWEYRTRQLEIFLKYNIRQPKPDEYPLTVFPTDKVPAALADSDIRWLDNDTIAYVPATGLTPEKLLERDRLLPLISVNLTNFESKELLKVSSSHFCFDYETHNFIAHTSGRYAHDKTEYSYGKLGDPLKTFVRPGLARGEHQKGPWSNHHDCTFFEAIPEAGVNGRTNLREADGDLTLEKQNRKDVAGSYVFTSPDGTVKRFSLGSALFVAFKYDPFSKLYWHSETLMPDKRLKVWRFDKDFKLVSEEIYPRGPWPTSRPVSILEYSVKPGFLIPSYILGAKNGKTTRSIHHLVYLVTKEGNITAVAEDTIGGPSGGKLSISPDGCRAVSTKTNDPDDSRLPLSSAIAVLDICKTNKGEKQ